MKIKQIINVLSVLMLTIIATTAVFSTPSYALTTWQEFVKEKCEGSSADAATRCSKNLNNRLKQKCGEPKNEGNAARRYAACWRNFINDNGGQAGRNDTPFEREDPGEEQDTGNGSGWADGDGCGGANTAIIKCEADNSGTVEDNGIWAILILVINIMTAGVGVLAVAGIVYGSILYTTAGDKSDQVKKAIDIITNVVIGLVAFGLMWAGLNFLIPGGVFR